MSSTYARAQLSFARDHLRKGMLAEAQSDLAVVSARDFGAEESGSARVVAAVRAAKGPDIDPELRRVLDEVWGPRW